MNEESQVPENEVEEEQVEEPQESGGEVAGTFQEQAARLLKLKIDGQEMELPEDEVIKYAQMGKKANQSMQEAAQEKKRILRLREMAKQDPMAVLREFNPDFNEDDYINQKLSKKMERQMKSKEELERDDALEELQRYRDKEAEIAKQKETEEFDKLVTESRAVLDKEIAEALQSISLKPSKATVKRLASYMLMARNENLNLSAKDLAGVVKQDMINEYMEQLELSDDETFTNLIGEKNLSRSQKIALAKMRKTPNPNATTKTTPAPEKKSDKIYDIHSFLKENLKG